jgi:uncharacterized protein YjiS (DUF1127 family)
MEALHLRRHSPDPRPIAVVGLLARAIDRLWEWRGRARERRQLSELSDAMLKDIGISRAEASSEFEKPFWRT